MLDHPLQRLAFEAIAAALPIALDPARVDVVPGVSYSRGPIKVHDYAVGAMAAFGCAVEHLGRLRGLPEQTLTLDRRHCGLLLNSAQLGYLNGHPLQMDTWPVGADNGTYRAADGRYVTMVGLHPHLRDGLLDYLQCVGSATGIGASVARKPAQQIEDEANARGLALGVVRSRDEWHAHPVGAHAATLPVIDVDSRPGARRRRLGVARRRPLEGVRVVEMAHLVAGPTIGKSLAEQGADVIKVQAPVSDWVLPLWLDVNWGKKSIIVDIKSPSGRARLLELLADADVLINSNRPGALFHAGLGDDVLRATNPDLVVANVSYAPAATEWAGRRGFEQIGQAVTGVIDITSQGLAQPSLVSVLMNDYLTGYLGATGVVAALAERERAGGGWTVGASLIRCAMLATELTAPRDAEPYAPCSPDDLVRYAVDQPSPWGLFTRLGPPIAFSRTPSWTDLPPPYLGTHPDTTGWDDFAPTHEATDVPHEPSRVAREGGIRLFLSTYGIEDRGDGGGEVSLASKSLYELAMAARAR